MRRAIRAVAFGLLFLPAGTAWSEVKTLNGKVSCSMCRGSHQMGKKTDAECVRACVKHGAKYVLMSGDDMYILPGDPSQFEYYADKSVTIRGDVDQDRIVKIETISIKQ
jgi:hypothetical protein